MNKLTVEDLDVKGKRVLVRVDFNVPLDESLNITDDKRIRAALPTIEHLIDNGARTILCSHLGRPKDGPEDKFRLDPVAKRLSELLGRPVKKLDDCIGPEVEAAEEAMADSDVILLENTRFHKEEKKNDFEFSKALAAKADLYVNDAFGSAHRAHCSTEGVTQFVSKSAAGYLLSKEIEYFSKVLEDPGRPFVAILGGAKVSDKIPTIENLMDKANTLIIGGGMAYTFLLARGQEIGNSLLEKERIIVAKEIMKAALDKDVALLLPIDHVAVQEFKADAETMQVPRGSIDEGWQGVDIGPQTVEKFGRALRDAKTVIWNGPLGVFEMEPFAKGTRAIADILAGLDATTIIGGGDTAAAISKFGLEDKMSHISTGGGASLEMMEGRVLPGLAALTDKE
ncbi:phosphoglycerate kinase [Candidatus Hydrogenedentota bacterium]